MRVATFLASTLFSCTAFAWERPPAGADTDVRREVSLMQSAPADCLSLRLGDALVGFVGASGLVTTKAAIVGQSHTVIRSRFAML